MSSRTHEPLERLLSFSQGITLEWANQVGWAKERRWEGSEEGAQLSRFFPSLEGLWARGAQADPGEFGRTLSHTFNAIAVYNRILSRSFPESGLSDPELEPVYRLSASLAQANPALMPLILWLHDMGRLEDKEHHPEKGAQLIRELGLLQEIPLSPEAALLVTKVVESHLLVGTLYSGEISFLGFSVLLNDPELVPFLTDLSQRELFVEALILFTMIDVWAYPYNARAISAAMIGNYLQIADELRSVLEKGDNLPEARQRLVTIAQKTTDWRLSCYLRAFSHIGTQPYLTSQFYQQKVIEGAGRYAQQPLSPEEWQSFKAARLSKFHQIQFKYALGLLCLLSFRDLGRFREGCTPTTQMNPQVFDLLTRINGRIAQEESTLSLGPDRPWDVILTGTPNWTRPIDLFDRLEEDPAAFQKIVDEGTVKPPREGKSPVLYLNFKPCWRYLD
ncbi:MAG: hypothetical protein HYY20_09480 [Candidatus Tectomicrobia bacterium]|uniref:HD domain-containing protein n=1 Tax=Tectimicrobiota bacterium TaxID=2528274 RepID=A0A932CPI3_UNCTE|nr:hypothetical protein [Candidatus Tectomicrobia bacterium]